MIRPRIFVSGKARRRVIVALWRGGATPPGAKRRGAAGELLVGQDTQFDSFKTLKTGDNNGQCDPNRSTHELHRDRGGLGDRPRWCGRRRRLWASGRQGFPEL